MVCPMNRPFDCTVCNPTLVLLWLTERIRGVSDTHSVHPILYSYTFTFFVVKLFACLCALAICWRKFILWCKLFFPITSGNSQEAVYGSQKKMSEKKTGRNGERMCSRCFIPFLVEQGRGQRNSASLQNKHVSCAEIEEKKFCIKFLLPGGWG